MNEEQNRYSRRQILANSGLALGSLTLPHLLAADEKVVKTVRPIDRYADLLQLLKKRGHKTQVVGYAPDRSPIVVVKAGGTKEPGIVISAAASFLHALGIDHKREYHTPTGRPVMISRNGEPIRELFS